MIKTVVLSVVAVAGATAGCKHGEHEQSSAKSFFPNSVRRDATDDESRFLARLGECSAFFVRNTTGKNLVITARHCTNWDIESWCVGANNFVIADRNNAIHVCTRVLISDPNYDMAMIEVAGDVHPPEASLRLASFVPIATNRLYMVGYPVDRNRSARRTVSENCWILRSDLESPHLRQSIPISRAKDTSFTHNCSTFSGNSGGPMMLENTDVAIGIPFTFRFAYDEDYNPLNEGFAEDETGEAFGVQMANFVQRNQRLLGDLGVVLAE